MKKKVILMVSIIYAVSACAWGSQGHRVIAQIAQDHLTAKTQAQIHVILSGRDLADDSLWADNVRADRHDPNAKRGYWHWVNHAIDQGRFVRVSGGLIQAIDQATLVLQHRSSRLSQLQALRWLIHLIADAYQPLHGGYASDHGGNDCHIYWFGRPSQLHRLWDSQLLAHQAMSYTEKAAQLTRANHNSQWLKSWPLGNRHQVDACYPKGIEPGHCPKQKTQWPRLGYAYYHTHYQQLDHMLYQAGLQLGHRLNVIFDPQYQGDDASQQGIQDDG